jgi:ActR/RegA family two-component response regulator
MAIQVEEQTPSQPAIAQERQNGLAMTPRRARLLIVDDEEALMTALCHTLETDGYATTGFTSAREALGQLRQRQFYFSLPMRAEVAPG